MGSGYYDTHTYSTTVGASLRSSGIAGTFAHSTATAALPASLRAAHALLDVNGVALREARDSDEHPESFPISVLIDVTGSMARIPAQITEKLPELNGLLVRKHYATDPQIMVGGIGDATCDSVPLQISQWESDNRIDEAITSLFLEGGGGGQSTESYELAMYYMARHTETDAYTKRGLRPILFIIGDEMAYSTVSAWCLREVLGLPQAESVPTTQIVEELKEKFEVFFIIPRNASNGRREEIVDYWKNFFGQNVLRPDNVDMLVELIGVQVGLYLGNVDLSSVEADLIDVFGISRDRARSIANAVVPVAGSSVAVRGTGDLPVASVVAEPEGF